MISHSTTLKPSVSVIIPTYNEAENIEQVIRNFLATSYSNLTEILVIDGCSTDRTPQIVQNIAQQDERVKLLSNPLRIQSAALNIGLEASQGDIFLRADAHCIYAPDYIEACVEALNVSQAFNVGGAQRFVALNSWQAGVAIATRSAIGSGGSKYRNPNYDGYGETVFLGCFQKDILEQVGGYSITRKEDSELNFRLLQKSPLAIYISSKIKVWYFPRKTWLGLCNQYIKYGRGSYLMSKRYSNQLPLRNKIPFFGISTIALGLIFDLTLLNGSLHLIWLICLCLILIFIEAARVTLKYRCNFAEVFWRGSPEQIPLLIVRWFYCGVAIATMPLAHFIGYGYQLFQRTIIGNQESCFFESQSYLPKEQTSPDHKISV
ncbi:MAG: glycosyltransferase family 2 protein [Xenococcaceae cyanobacterium MO_167.B27]|nr:glycosyltransferase family 2 protein [Xenococcaceae cyanobacterium MO_167.B27]